MVENVEKLRETLEPWLREMFYRDNHTKYKHLFEPWFANLTDSQLYYFGEQKRHIENGSLTNWITK